MTAAGESPSPASAAWRRAQVPRHPKRAPDHGAGSSSHPGPAPWAAPRPSARVVASGFIGINSRAVNSPRSVVFRWPQAAPAWPLLRQPANSRTSSSSPKKPCAHGPSPGPSPRPGPPPGRPQSAPSPRVRAFGGSRHGPRPLGPDQCGAQRFRGARVAAAPLLRRKGSPLAGRSAAVPRSPAVGPWGGSSRAHGRNSPPWALRAAFPGYVCRSLRCAPRPEIARELVTLHVTCQGAARMFLARSLHLPPAPVRRVLASPPPWATPAIWSSC